MSRALSFASLTATEAESLGVLARRAIALPLTLPATADSGQDPVVLGELCLRHLPDPAMRERPWAEGAGLVLRVHWAGASFECFLSSDAVSVMLHALWGEALSRNLSPAWTVALDGMLGAWVVGQFERLGRGKAELLALQRMAAAPVPAPAVHVFVFGIDWAEGASTRPTASVVGRLITSALGLHVLAGVAGSLPQTAGQDAAKAGNAGNAADASHAGDAMPGLRQVLRAVVGTTRLALAELRGLRVGDAILIEDRFLDAEDQLWLSLGRGEHGETGFIARLGDQSLTLTQGPMERNPSVTDTPHTPSLPEANPEASLEDTGPLPVEALPVELSFDLGGTTLSVAELRALRPGQVISTSRLTRDYVAIRVNGALVGRGVLMDVDGRLAVSITALASEPGS